MQADHGAPIADFPHHDRVPLRVRHSLGDLDRLGAIRRLDQRETRDDLLGLREGAIVTIVRAPADSRPAPEVSRSAAAARR